VETQIESVVDEDAVIDRSVCERDAKVGALALQNLRKAARDDFTSWAAAIRGLRGLRELAFAKTGARDIKSWHYRQELGALLSQGRWAVYSDIDAPTRSSCYKLMDRIDDIAVWYAGLSSNDQLRWKHPDTIAKHCPPEYLSSGIGHNQPKPNQPKPTGKKKRPETANEERLRNIILNARAALKIEDIGKAIALLEGIYQPDFDDSLKGTSLEAKRPQPAAQ
jgi:hypothetical protein